MTFRDQRSVGHPRQTFFLVAGGIFLSLLMIASMAWAVAANREAELRDASRELENLSRALSESTDRAFGYAEVVENDIMDRVMTLGIKAGDDVIKLGTPEFQRVLQDKIANTSYLDAISIIGSKGDLINFTRAWPIPNINVSDRDYFKALSGEANGDVFIGEPVRNRGNGTWTIYLAKRMVGPQHQFIGLILAAMKVAYFEESYSSFAMQGGRVSLFRNTGAPLARYPHVDSEYGKSYASLEIFDRSLVRNAGSVYIKSLGDGMNTRRILSFNRLEHYPLIMTVSKSLSAILADWGILVRIIIIVTACVVLCIASAVFLLLRSIKRSAADADRLSYMARHDALTGLPNRVLFQERMETAILGIPDRQNFSIMCLDLDHFKEINDMLGHAVGDALLRDVASRLMQTVHAGDTVARIGGDEFAVVQASFSGPDDANLLAARIVDVIGKPYDVLGNVINIGASVGIACAPRDDDVGARLLSKADIALYRAKLDGGRHHRFFESMMEEELQTRRALELDLRRAVRDREFELLFQPLVDARTKSIRSFEALVRWNHPDRGRISPIDFIPLAEEMGLIGPLGEWILHAACAQAALWPDTISVSVNISVCQFKLSNLAEVVARSLAGANLAPGRLELEITESVLLNENDKNLDMLHALRTLGVKIVMDDFGTGYSSLNYLRVFPFDKIKIDKSFVQNLDHNSANEIVRLIVNLGKKLGMQTTAEGVETEAQLEEVVQLGCTELQGYLFSRPIPAWSTAGLISRSMGQQAA